MDPVQKETNSPELLEWHKPVIERLAVSLDTRQGSGSFTDFAGYTTTPIGG